MFLRLLKQMSKHPPAPQITTFNLCGNNNCDVSLRSVIFPAEHSYLNHNYNGFASWMLYMLCLFPSGAVFHVVLTRGGGVGWSMLDLMTVSYSCAMIKLITCSWLEECDLCMNIILYLKLLMHTHTLNGSVLINTYTNGHVQACLFPLFGSIWWG